MLCDEGSYHYRVGGKDCASRELLLLRDGIKSLCPPVMASHCFALGENSALVKKCHRGEKATAPFDGVPRWCSVQSESCAPLLTSLCF